MSADEGDRLTRVAHRGDKPRDGTHAACHTSHLRQTGAEPIALKGSLQSRWLYGTPRRPSLDLDILIEAALVPAASEALRSLGYLPYLDRGDGASTDYAQTWHKDGSATIDLHWSLAGADPERLWPALFEATEEMAIGTERVRIPTIAGRALVIALHAAQHGSGSSHAVDDLSRALEIVDPASWAVAIKLAHEAGAVEAFAAGLRLVPAGEMVAGAFGLTRVTTTELEIRAIGEPPTALAFERLSRSLGLAAKGRVVGHELVPPPSFMRDKYSIATRGSLGLCLAYAYRPFWLLRWAVPGYLTWRRATRRSKSSRDQ